MISLTPFGVLGDCGGHIHLTDGETDRKRQGERSRSQRVPTWTQAPLIPSPIHLHETSSFQTALCGVLGSSGRPEAGTEEEVEKEEEEVAHFAQGQPISGLCVRLIWKICVANKVFSEDYPSCFFPGNWIQAALSLQGQEETCFLLDDALHSKMATHGTVKGTGSSLAWCGHVIHLTLPLCKDEGLAYIILKIQFGLINLGIWAIRLS